MTNPPKGSRARIVITDDVTRAIEKLEEAKALLVGLETAMRSANFDPLLKVDGGDAISDAVQLITGWHYKVKGLFEVQRVAHVMQLPAAAKPEAAPKARARRK